jgi:putative nucleotidyltransferase-like protein
VQPREWCVEVAASGLPGRRPRPPLGPVPERQWPDVLSRIKSEALTGFAVRCADDGSLPVTPDQRAALNQVHVEAMAHAVRLERQLVTVADLLGGLGMPFRVLKGSAVAHLDYADTALRSFGDVDVLVTSSDVDRALAALLEAGYRRATPEAHEGFDRRFGKGATLLTDDDYELDLHRTLAMGPLGYTVRVDDLWDDSQVFRVGGRDFAALAVEQRMLHACLHAVIGNPHHRIQPHRDVAEMVLFGSYSQARLLELADRWRAQDVVARALTSTWDLFGLGVYSSLVDWARARPDTARANRMLTLYDVRTSYAALSLGSLRVMPWRDRVVLIRMLVAPSADLVADRSRYRWLVDGALHAFRDRSRNKRRDRVG